MLCVPLFSCWFWVSMHNLCVIYCAWNIGKLMLWVETENYNCEFYVQIASLEPGTEEHRWPSLCQVPRYSFFSSFPTPFISASPQRPRHPGSTGSWTVNLWCVHLSATWTYFGWNLSDRMSVIFSLWYLCSALNWKWVLSWFCASIALCCSFSPISFHQCTKGVWCVTGGVLDLLSVKSGGHPDLF